MAGPGIDVSAKNNRARTSTISGRPMQDSHSQAPTMGMARLRDDIARVCCQPVWAQDALLLLQLLSSCATSYFRIPAAACTCSDYCTRRYQPCRCVACTMNGRDSTLRLDSTVFIVGLKDRGSPSLGNTSAMTLMFDAAKSWR